MHYTIWVTHDCNLKCTYCYEGKDKKKDKMSMDTAFRMLNYIKKNDSFSENDIGISIHGGEPLMNYEVLHYIVKEVKLLNKKVMVDMTTNATLINDDNLKFLINNIDELSISIDGLPEIHNQNRKFKNGNDSFDMATKYISEILKQKKDVIARMTVTSKTVKRMYDSVTYLYNLGFKVISPIIDYYDPDWNKMSLEVLKEQLIKINKYCINENDDIRIGMLEMINYRGKSKCCAGEKTLNIASDGEFYSCAYVVGNEKFNIGNVVDGIKDEKIKLIKDINESKIEKCENCAWKECCNGYRCKFLNYAIWEKYEPVYIACAFEKMLLQLNKYFKQ